MKKLLLSALALGAGLAAMAQGITTKAAFDDFMKASDYSDQYSTITEEALFPCTPEEDSAYIGIFTYDDQDQPTFTLSQNRNMSEGRLELDVFQGKGSYEPFGFVWGSYCENDAEQMFTLDLSENSMLEFDVYLEEFLLGSTTEGTVDGPTDGAQIKIQAEDINGTSLVYDQSVVGNTDGDYRYEIGATGDGAQNSNNFLDGANYLMEGETLSFSYDLADAWPATDNVPDNTNTFDYSQVVAIKITFAAVAKDSDNDYDPYEHTATYYISNLKVGDVEGEGLMDDDEPDNGTGVFDFSSSANDFEVYPNPATETVNFAKRLTNVEVYNAQGVLVENVSSANALNVASYEAGVYFIKASEGTSRILVK